MLAAMLLLPIVAAQGAVVGTFSGVSLDNLMQTPIIGRESIAFVSGADLLKHGTGMVARELDGEAVIETTEKDFSVQYEAELEPGTYLVIIEAMGTNGGNDSYWLEVDGERKGGVITLPVGVMGERSTGIDVAEPGKRQIKVVLRESPGSMLKSFRLAKMTLNAGVSPMRDELRGKHPRLYITPGDIDKLRARLGDETVKEFYRLPSLLTKKPAPYRPGQRNGGGFRALGSYAMGYLLEPDEKQLESILQWLEMATTYPDAGVDLDAEYFMEGLALTYDWLYEYIPEDLRGRVRDTIVRQCRLLFEASLGGRTGGGLSFQQNHYWFAHLALALGAVAVYDEVPEADLWLPWVWDRFERIALTFGTDGGFHEGPSYWDYSMPTFYMLIDLYESCTGLRIPWADEGLPGQAEFRLHHMYPGLVGSATLEDTTVPAGRPPTRLLLWTAKRYQDPVAMGIAHALNTGPSWLNSHLLSLDEALGATPHDQAIPLAKHYADIETAFARSSWDADATWAAFVSRPMGGHMYAALCEKYGIGGTGHNHPEQNHFMLFGRGEVLADDPGYTYEKLTRNHNTVLVDGKGQYGDGEMWPRPNPGRANITGFKTEGDVTIVSGDATSAYPPDLGLTRFDRTLVLAGRDLAVVYDRLAAKEPRTFSWLLHHHGTVTQREGSCIVTRNKAQLAITPVMPATFEFALSDYRPQFVHPTRDHTPEEADISLIEIKSGPVQEATFLVPLQISDAGGEVVPVKREPSDTCDAVRLGNILVAFNRGEGEMTVQLPWGEKLTTSARAIVARTTDDGENQIITAG